MTTLYIATTNPGKLRDFSAATHARDIVILPLPNLNVIAAPPEDEPTFVGNAIAKAIYYSNHLSGELVVADDSGLEVDALHGAPGVRSARYATDQGFTRGDINQDELNNQCLLANLERVPTNQRSARYKCSLAAARNGECLFTSEGAVEGEILTAPRGSGGFGYDPLFYLSTLSKTMAELDLATKDLLSHRGIAMRALLVQIHNKLL
jgi:XTP/dITP diphosphohydrolase